LLCRFAAGGAFTAFHYFYGQAATNQSSKQKQP
jgi:hypothetical protein